MPRRNGAPCQGGRDAGQGVLRTLENPLPEHAACREFICIRAKIDSVYYKAIIATTDGVLAYIEAAPTWPARGRKSIEAVKVAERDGSLEEDVYQSELRVHRLALSALHRAWPRIHVDHAEIIYCYPFAVRSEKPGRSAP